jgi:cell division protein FtsZ
MGLFEMNAAAEIIHGVAHQDANIIFGTVIDDEMGDEVRSRSSPPASTASTSPVVAPAGSSSEPLRTSPTRITELFADRRRRRGSVRPTTVTTTSTCRRS